MWWRAQLLLDALFDTVGLRVLKILAPLFFDSKYLKGRHFERGGEGWKWVRRSLLTQRLLAFNRHVPWPVSPFIVVSNPRNISFHPDDLNNFQTFGCYFQNFSAQIILGKGTYIAPNVGIITANHDPLQPSAHSAGEDVTIGEASWIGMNAILLPGVTLGPHTVVGAGAVVTHSFPEGYVMLAGNPARVLRQLTPNGGELPSSD